MLKIFQIGDTPVHFHQQKWHGWDIKSNGKVEDLLWSPQKVWQNTQFMMDVQSVKLTSVVIDETGRLASQQIEKLKRLVGLPTTIIAYDVMSFGDMDSCLCQLQGIQAVPWYSTFGVLNSITEDEEAQGFTSITLNITANPYWSMLNRYLWNWQGGDFDPYYPPLISTPYQDFIYQYPGTDGLVPGFGDFHWSRRPVDRLVAYDPALWAKLHLNTGLPFETGTGATWGASYHAAYCEPTEWSAPPLSLYAFKNLPTSGEVVIKVRHLEGIATVKEYITTIDLVETNMRLLAAGYPALQLTDIVYVGDCYPKPGFIVRDGVVLDTPPHVIYPEQWPGQCSVGKNGIIFVLPGFTEAAYLHTYRRM